MGHPVNWDLTSIKNSDHVCYQYVTFANEDAIPNPKGGGWKKEIDGWKRLNPVTNALITSAPYVLIPDLTYEEMDEFHYRLDCLFEVGAGFMHTTAANGEGTIPIRIQRGDLLKHIGLHLDVHRKSNQDFDTNLRSIRMMQIKESHLPEEPT